jgi:hemerythrin-like domain-containing protein
MDALTLLREDHLEVLAMLDELERQPADAGSVTPDDHANRKQLVTKLIMAESAHEAVEEQYFWPSVQHWFDQGSKLAEPALQQEQEAKGVLAELDKLEPSDTRFEALVSRIIHDAREHIAYEENEVWPLVRERLAPSALEEMGVKMARAKKAAPTRPHPHTPPKPSALKTAGVAAAATDRVRDAVTGRGKSDQDD